MRSSDWGRAGGSSLSIRQRPGMGAAHLSQESNPLTLLGEQGLPETRFCLKVRVLHYTQPLPRQGIYIPQATLQAGR